MPVPVINTSLSRGYGKIGGDFYIIDWGKVWKGGREVNSDFLYASHKITLCFKIKKGIIINVLRCITYVLLKAKIF